jgi:hypothetical protein
MTTIEDLCALLPAELNGAPTQPGFYVVEAGSIPARVVEVEVVGGGVWWGRHNMRHADITRHAPIAFTSVAETRRANDAEAERDALKVEVERLKAALEREMERQFRVGVVLAESGCDCDCGHHYDDHDDDCERCLGCRVEAALRSRP